MRQKLSYKLTKTKKLMLRITHYIHSVKARWRYLTHGMSAEYNTTQIKTGLALFYSKIIK